MKKTILLLTLFCLANASFAQSWKELNDSVKTNFSSGNYELALNFAKKALLQAEKEFEKSHKNYGTSLNNLAFMCNKMGQYEKALPLYLEALKNTEKTLGKDHSTYGIRLNNLAHLYETMGQYEKALPLYLEALKNTENALGKGHSSYGIRLNNLAALYKNMGQYEKALPLYLEALENTENALGKDHSTYGIRLNNLAHLYETMEQYEKALPLYLEALQNTEKTLGKDHSSYGMTLNNLAGLYQTMGQYEKALPLYLEALQNCEKALGKDHSTYGTYLNNLALLYGNMGQYEKALPLYLEALQNTEKTLGKGHSSYGIRLNNLSVLYQTMGQYEKALPLYLEALQNCEKALGKDHSTYGTYLNNLALLYGNMGQYEKALPLYLEALQNTEKTLGKDHAEYGTSLNNLAGLYQSMGQYEKALPLYLEALQNTQKVLGKDHSAYGTSLNNLANLYDNMGQYEKALPLYLEALQNTEKAQGKDHSEYGTRLNNLANLYNNMWQNEKALPLYLEALKNTEKALGKDHSSYGMTLNSLAGLYQSIVQYEKAIPLYLEAKGIILNNIEKNFSFMGEKEKEAYLKTVSFNFNAYHSFFLRHNKKYLKLSAEAYDIELAAKGMILSSGLQMKKQILNSGNQDVIETYENWSLKKTSLAKQYSLPIAERSKELKTMEAEAEALEGALARMSSAFKTNKSLFSIDWKAVQNTLGSNQAAVEFASFDYHNDKEWTDSTMYVAIVLRKQDKQPQLVPLFEKKQLEKLLEKKASSDNSFVSTLYRGFELEEKKQAYGKDLYKLLWQPIDSLLSGIKTVYYSPSGLLHQMAYAAIPVSDSTVLSDKYDLQQLSTTAQLAIGTNSTQAKPSSIALFGGIKYDTDTSLMVNNAQKSKANEAQLFASRSLPADIERGGTWSYLPGTLQETEAINKLSISNKMTAKYFKGNDALEESFKSLEADSSPEILHIATHGFFFPDPTVTQTKKMTFSDTREQAIRQSANPLNRSGLLFSGALNVWQGKPVPQGLEDGILSAYEVSNMYLPNTRLVVLSACETGLGDVKGSEGVFGLQRAFKMAGAKYIIMSLWKVPDAETAEFMAKFYTSLYAGKSIPDAFAKTQTQMKKKYRNDPYKWAAFVLVR